jgi:hypothetical protein
MFRPRLSDDHARELQTAAALAGLTATIYLERVVRPMVQADLRRRADQEESLRRRGGQEDA